MSIYNLNSHTDIAQYFSRTYKAIDESTSVEQLDAIYQETSELLKFSYDLKWSQRFGNQADELQLFVADKMTKVIAMLNRRAGELNAKVSYRLPVTGAIGKVHGGRIDPITLE